jgi:hypothetical protein
VARCRSAETGGAGSGALYLRWHGSEARLVIITCGGPFDYATHHYYDNVVAYGIPLQG